jgi:uncharacterized protein YjbI with pentapeptide repeats
MSPLGLGCVKTRWCGKLIEQGANLYNAQLKEANLLGANLMEARIWEANLSGVNLSRAPSRTVATWSAPV